MDLCQKVFIVGHLRLFSVEQSHATNVGYSIRIEQPMHCRNLPLGAHKPFNYHTQCWHKLEWPSLNLRWSLVLFHWSSVLFPLATNDHWFSMPVGPLPLAAVGLADQQPKQVLAGSFQLLFEGRFLLPLPTGTRMAQYWWKNLLPNLTPHLGRCTTYWDHWNSIHDHCINYYLSLVLFQLCSFQSRWWVDWWWQ